MIYCKDIGLSEYIYLVMQDPQIRFYLKAADIILDIRKEKFNELVKVPKKFGLTIFPDSQNCHPYRIDLGGSSDLRAALASAPDDKQLTEWLYEQLVRVGLE